MPSKALLNESYNAKLISNHAIALWRFYSLVLRLTPLRWYSGDMKISSNHGNKIKNQPSVNPDPNYLHDS